MPLQCGQIRTSSWNTRFMSSAHEYLLGLGSTGRAESSGCGCSPAHGASAASEDFSQQALEHLTEARFVFVSEPISGQFLPQVLGLADVGAVDFDKGCYLGQEIVARAAG